MSKKQKSKKSKRESKPREKYSQETRGAEFFTIGWLLSGMTAFAAQFAGLLAYALSGDSPVAGVFSRYVFFSAMVIGGISGLLTILVYRLRSVPPPRVVTIVILINAFLPLVFWAVIFGF